MNKHRLRVLAVPIIVLLTVLASAGAASAATGGSGTAAVGSSQELAVHVTPRPGAVQPAITYKTCNSSTAHWVHLRINNPTAPDQCLGFAGTWTNYGNVPISGFCGGNNYGTWTGWNASGNYISGSFHQGTTYTTFGVALFNTITIDGWYGNETCPY